MSDSIDLLSPHDSYRKNYAYQVRSTIDAYSIPMTVIGEALQNAIDAICENKSSISKGIITASINFDTNTIEVVDNGVGFPQDISLLYLGGTDKQGKMLKGKVGVGIKVAMFCSEHFSIKSRRVDGSWKVEVSDAYKFESLNGLRIPSVIPPDPQPLNVNGTHVTYRFPEIIGRESQLARFVHEIRDTVLPQKMTSGFWVAVNSGVAKYPSAFAVMMSAFLCRFSYVGDVLNSLNNQTKFPANGIDISINITCADPIAHFGVEIGSLFGNNTVQNFTISPSYLRVEDTVKWVQRGKIAPKIFNERLGNGGSDLEKSNGFNSLVFNSIEEYELLLINKAGRISDKVSEFRSKLFPHINGIMLTIGRIPDFEQFLPGGSRRVISCNGVITSHEIDLTRGRNQEYVRCFDLVIDLNAELNYGKTHITNNHLVKIVREYLNEAYLHTIQNGAGNWVGKIPSPEDEDTEIFINRGNLGISNFTTRKVPHDENDVIGLFFELAGRGYFSQYYIFGLSQKDTYDCRAAIRRESDPISVLSPTDDTKLRVVEFKVNATDVIRDFERMNKAPRDIHLVIAWDSSDYDSRNYAIYDIDQSQAYRASPKRVFPLVTRYIQDSKSGAEVQLILLKEIIEDIKNSILVPAPAL